MKKLILFVLIFVTLSAYGQKKSKFLYAEFSDQSVTLYPFYKVFGGTFDPALTLGWGINYKEKANSAFFQTVQLTGYTTVITGQGFNLTTSIGYRYRHSSGIFAEGLLGVGASLFFPVRETFLLDETGTYIRANPIRIISSVPVDLLLGYRIKNYSFYLKYRYMMQGPYSETMPALPTSLTGVGMRYDIPTSSN